MLRRVDDVTKPPPKTTALVPHRPNTALSTDLRQLADDAREFIVDSVADNTKKAYASDWAAFSEWCEQNNLSALPALPSTIVMYLAARAKGGGKVASLQRYLASISAAHKTAGHASPTHDPVVKRTMQGVRRKLGTKQKQKTAAVADEVALMVEQIEGSSPAAARDRALLLLGFAGAFRRSELVALDIEHVEFVRPGPGGVPGGMLVAVERSKTDQEGQGQQLAVVAGKNPATCPVRAVRALLGQLPNEGPLFRGLTRPVGAGRLQGWRGRLSDRSVALIVKKHAESAGLDPALYAGHSLRAGFATTAALRGKDLKAIMKQTRHTRIETVLKYIRNADPFEDNATDDIGL
jgi:site-specific recombinase XerD